MSLLELPPELLDDIIGLTLPDGLESLALSCRTIYRVGKDHIQRHNQYRRQWKNFRYNESGSSNLPNIRVPLELVTAILKDPLIAEYIETAHLWLEIEHDFDTDARIASALQGLDKEAAIQTLLRWWRRTSHNLKTPYFDPDALVKYLRAGLDQQNEPGIYGTTIILMLLPNVRELGLSDCWQRIPDVREDDEPNDTPMMIMEAVVKTACDPAARDASLTKLERIVPHAVVEYDTRNALDELGIFMALPSLKEVYASNCVGVEDGYTGIPFQWPYQHLNSGLRRIELYGCCIDEEGITELLEHTPQVTALKYSHDVKWHGCLFDWDGGAFVDAIGSLLGETLTELAVTLECSVNEMMTGVGSLRAFKCLEEMEFDIDLFNARAYGSDELAEWDISEVPSLVAMLPSSVKSVHLIQTPAGSGLELATELLLQLLRGLSQKGRASLPNLEELDVRAVEGVLRWEDLLELPAQDDAALREAMKTACGEESNQWAEGPRPLWTEAFQQRFPRVLG